MSGILVFLGPTQVSIHVNCILYFGFIPLDEDNYSPTGTFHIHVPLHQTKWHLYYTKMVA